MAALGQLGRPRVPQLPTFAISDGPSIPAGGNYVEVENESVDDPLSGFSRCFYHPGPSTNKGQEREKDLHRNAGARSEERRVGKECRL